jgi:hypothetical protein
MCAHRHGWSCTILLSSIATLWSCGSFRYLSVSVNLFVNEFRYGGEEMRMLAWKYHLMSKRLRWASRKFRYMSWMIVKSSIGWSVVIIRVYLLF